PSTNRLLGSMRMLEQCPNGVGASRFGRLSSFGAGGEYCRCGSPASVYSAELRSREAIIAPLVCSRRLRGLHQRSVAPKWCSEALCIGSKRASQRQLADGRNLANL